MPLFTSSWTFHGDIVIASVAEDTLLPEVIIIIIISSSTVLVRILAASQRRIRNLFRIPKVKYTINNKTNIEAELRVNGFHKI
jgi:hypothetical protein